MSAHRPIRASTTVGRHELAAGSSASARAGLRSSWFSLRLLDLQRATRTRRGVRIVGRSAPDGRVGVDGLIRGGWVRLATGRSHRGRLVVETATRGATVVRLRAGAARSYAVAVP